MALTVHGAVFAALALTGAGVAALYGSWRGAVPARPIVRAFGWACLLLAAWPWAAAAGAEFGIVYACAVPAVFAWLLVARTAQWRSSARGRRAAERVPAEEGAAHRPVLRHLGLFALTVPLAGAASGLIVVAASAVLPGNEVARGAFALLAAPFAWGAAAFWAVADPKPLRPAASLAACALVGAAVVFL